MRGNFSTTCCLVAFTFLLVMGNIGFAEQIIYVDANATGLNDGTSWENAYNFLQDALADANSSAKVNVIASERSERGNLNTIIEIRVAQGIYRPDETSAEPNGTGDRTATFQLINGVAIKGGYAGFGEPDPNARDIERYKTILSGDLYGNDVEVKDPCDLLTEPTRAENSYHIFYHPQGLKLDVTAILEGFMITGGKANGSSWPHTDGGGMLNDWLSKPTLTNCTFIGNSANHWGGGMLNSYASSSAVTGCTFSKNSANVGGGMVSFYSSPTLTNCTFSGNSANGGGGMGNVSSSPTLTNCTFSGNSATEWGGGMSNGSSISTLTNCTFSGNSANDGGGMYNSYNTSLTLNNCIFSSNSAQYGGGMYNYFGNKPTLTNCTITNNSAPNGSAIACDSDATVYLSTVTMFNCIVWNGSDWLWNNDNSTIRIAYSDVQGIWPGEGNLNKDPCFADPNNNDYHLKSQAGRWDPSENPKLAEGSWLKDDVTSPCIDAGDPASPIGLEPFPNGGIINMGAYGGTSEASKSYFGEPVCETIVAGDINGDCEVNFKDFALMAIHWLQER